MIVKKDVFSLFVFFILSTNCYSKKNFPHEELYQSAQNNFHDKKYNDALEKFNKYLELTKNSKHAKKRIFWAIDYISRIHLRIKADPESAIKLFDEFEKDKRLNDEQFDIIQEWKEVTKDWKKNRKTLIVGNEDQLFNLGKKYFENGNKKSKGTNYRRSDMDYTLSKNYLLKYYFEYPEGKHIAETLYLLGVIKYRHLADRVYWSENYYLKELINRFPHSDFSWKAWEKLNEDTLMGYTGSGGDNTPPEIKKMLLRYKVLAKPAK